MIYLGEVLGRGRIAKNKRKTNVSARVLGKEGMRRNNLMGTESQLEDKESSVTT